MMILKFKERLILFLIISLIISTGCSDKSKKYNYINYKKLKKPNNKVKLHSTIVNIYEVYALGAIAIIDNYLLLIDYKADEMIKIADLRSNRLLKSFGRQGQGPSEFIGASEIIPSPKDKNMFWIYDISTRKLKKFDINKVLNNKSDPEKIISIKEGNGTPAQLIITPDYKILGIGLFFKGRISIYNMSGDFIRSFGKIPVILKNGRFATQHSHGFTGKFVLKNISREIFIATRHGAIVEKYSMDGNLISTFYGPDSFFPEYKIVSAGDYYTMTYNEKTRFGYLDICYNKKLDRLFLLYSGKYQYNRENEEANFGNIVYVLDNKGTIIEEIELDKGIFRMTLADDGATLFGLADTELLKFEYNIN